VLLRVAGRLQSPDHTHDNGSTLVRVRHHSLDSIPSFVGNIKQTMDMFFENVQRLFINRGASGMDSQERITVLRKRLQTDDSDTETRTPRRFLPFQHSQESDSLSELDSLSSKLVGTTVGWSTATGCVLADIRVYVRPRP
jgi:hypothetical protein